MPPARSWFLAFAGCLAACVPLLWPAPAAAVVEPLTLRVNDGTAVPDGVLAVVIRTYSPRGVGQGQVCLRHFGNFAAGGGPLTRLIEARVFSEQGDAVVSASFDPVAQQLDVDFSSVSASINRSDGPMMALLFQVDDQLSPGASFTLEIDPGSSLLDGDGHPIEIEPRAGEMTIRSPLAPYEIDADGAEAAPGLYADAGVETAESLPLMSGTVVFLYDPAVVSGTPEVLMSPRHGTSTMGVALSPGRVEVSFTSADGSLNRVPGQFVTVRLPIAQDVTLGETSVVSLESGTTELVSSAGLQLTLALGDDVLEFVPTSALAMFYDGFESGGLDGWCAAVGGV